MSNLVQVPSDSGRSLPAELRVGARNGAKRLMANQAVMQRGVAGLGDAICGAGYSYDSQSDQCVADGSAIVSNSPATGSGSSGSGGSGAMSATDIANLIKSTSAALLPALIASHPGVQYTQSPNGQIMIYSQPTGTTANLPGTYGNVLGIPSVPGATYTTPGGQLAVNTTGLNVNTLMMVGVAGLLAVLLISKGK